MFNTKRQNEGMSLKQSVFICFKEFRKELEEFYPKRSLRINLEGWVTLQIETWIVCRRVPVLRMQKIGRFSGAFKTLKKWRKLNKACEGPLFCSWNLLFHVHHVILDVTIVLCLKVLAVNFNRTGNKEINYSVKWLYVKDQIAQSNW